MRVVADENFDAPLVQWLRSQGHDVVWMVEKARGSEDIAVLDQARSEERIILTFDRDFGELVFHRQLKASGVVLFRLRARSARSLLERVQAPGRKSKRSP
ncbi:MAG: DUF5615 family PIN-like protein [Phycisphaerales bacterium]|nr:DUF5615 family PIN-like protein [Phycisphaerales bacterium]MCI0631293.1 DUF5615 family PIN-like protein [Phycisphaerales bacterium]MCI0677314.1 DUF5615 family PIN-like protein [Phycisphaerales bacterium]